MGNIFLARRIVESGKSCRKPHRSSSSQCLLGCWRYRYRPTASEYTSRRQFRPTRRRRCPARGHRLRLQSTPCRSINRGRLAPHHRVVSRNLRMGLPSPSRAFQHITRLARRPSTHLARQRPIRRAWLRRMRRVQRPRCRVAFSRRRCGIHTRRRAANRRGFSHRILACPAARR